MVRRVCLALTLVLLATAAMAQNEADSPEGRACRGDARRFCAKEIGDEFRVASCLQEHRERLTRACRAVLEGHGM
jgi:hypothetical protein